MESKSMNSNAGIDPLRIAEEWMLAGREVAIATVIETWGSAPCPPGSHLVVNEDCEFEGSVSGGCVEGDVITQALEVIASGEPVTRDYGVAEETAWRAGLSCGGKIKIHIARVG